MPQIRRSRQFGHAFLTGTDLHIARAFSAAGNPRDPADGNLAPTVVGELFHDSLTDDVWLANGLTVADWIALRHDPIKLEATDSFSTPSASDVVATSGTGDDMTTTPAAGTYVATFRGSASGSNSATSAIMSIFAGGVQNQASEQTVGTTNAATPFAAAAVVVVDGTQAIEGRVRKLGSGSADLLERNMMVWRVR